MCGGGFYSLRKQVRRFADDTSGAITAFTVVVFMLMVVSVGMAIDFMRHEAFRAELQNALDRGVLAAASLTQTMPAKTTVKSYVKSTTFVDKQYKLDVSATTTGGARKVTALAEFQAKTFFLRLIGIPELTVAAYSAATEGVLDVEVSFAIDISDSMGKDDKVLGNVTVADFAFLPDNTSPFDLGWASASPTKLQMMKTVTKKFIDDLLSGSAKETVSVSLIPYAGAVNPGPYVFGKFAKNKLHNYSNCLKYLPADYKSYAPPALNSVDHMAHYQVFEYLPAASSEVDYGMCPGSKGEVIYMSNSKSKLKSHVDGLRAHSGTASHEAMKYALMMLNPQSRSFVNDLAEKGIADKKFKGRPYDYRSGESVKIAIIISDGFTQHDFDVKPRFYDEQDEIDKLAKYPNMLKVEEFPNDSDTLNGWKMRDRTKTRADLRNLCTAAKNDGVIVFTMAIDLVDKMHSNAVQDLNACASSGTFYHVKSGTDWTRAMALIKGKIDALRLVEQ